MYLFTLSEERCSTRRGQRKRARARGQATSFASCARRRRRRSHATGLRLLRRVVRVAVLVTAQRRRGQGVLTGGRARGDAGNADRRPSSHGAGVLVSEGVGRRRGWGLGLGLVDLRRMSRRGVVRWRWRVVVVRDVYGRVGGSDGLDRRRGDAGWTR